MIGLGRHHSGRDQVVEVRRAVKNPLPVLCSIVALSALSCGYYGRGYYGGGGTNGGGPSVFQGPQIGSVCDIDASVDPCWSAGLDCTPLLTDGGFTCQLPGELYSCDQSVGCASGLGCHDGYCLQSVLDDRRLHRSLDGLRSLRLGRQPVSPESVRRPGGLWTVAGMRGREPERRRWDLCAVGRERWQQRVSAGGGRAARGSVPVRPGRRRPRLLRGGAHLHGRRGGRQPRHLLEPLRCLWQWRPELRVGHLMRGDDAAAGACGFGSGVLQRHRRLRAELHAGERERCWSGCGCDRCWGGCWHAGRWNA